MRYLSVCSGIEAASVAWHPLGWKPLAFSEIEPFPRAVLAHHYPTVPLHGDFTTIKGDEYGPIDLLVGGTPCQDFSVAGLRAGITGERGNLTLEFLRLAARVAPRWIVWENVPGVLSSDGGRALGAFLGGLAQLGYGFAYRVLDAQYFGLAQRRQRVFVVGCLGDWRRAAAVLFERESLQGHPAPRREARKGIAPTLSARTKGGGGLGTDFDLDGGLIAKQWPASVAPTLNAAFGDKLGLEDQHALNGAGLFVAHSLRGEGFDASEDGTGRGTPLVPVAQPFSIMPMNSGKDYKARPVHVAQPIMAGGPVGGNQGGDYVVQPVAFDETQITSPANYSQPRPGDPCHPLAAGARPPAIVGTAVRRLTPRECERLQGFPDDYTLIPIGREPRKQKKGESDAAYAYYLAQRTGLRSADGPRYKALGNSMAVPVMGWIGRRIAMVEDIDREVAA